MKSSTIGTKKKKHDAVSGQSALLCRVTMSLCRESLLCDCVAGFATADRNKTKMAAGRKGRWRRGWDIQQERVTVSTLPGHELRSLAAVRKPTRSQPALATRRCTLVIQYCCTMTGRTTYRYKKRRKNHIATALKIYIYIKRRTHLAWQTSGKEPNADCFCNTFTVTIHLSVLNEISLWNQTTTHNLDVT